MVRAEVVAGIWVELVGTELVRLGAAVTGSVEDADSSPGRVHAPSAPAVTASTAARATRVRGRDTPITSVRLSNSIVDRTRRGNPGTFDRAGEVSASPIAGAPITTRRMRRAGTGVLDP